MTTKDDENSMSDNAAAGGGGDTHGRRFNDLKNMTKNAITSSSKVMPWNPLQRYTQKRESLASSHVDLLGYQTSIAATIIQFKSIRRYNQH